MTNIRQRLKRLVIGTLVSLLPLILAVVLAEFLFLTSPPAGGSEEQASRNHSAGIIVFTGLVMSGVAICGMGLYALDTLLRVLVIERQARKIERLRRQGRI